MGYPARCRQGMAGGRQVITDRLVAGTHYQQMAIFDTSIAAKAEFESFNDWCP